jgi:hypothetical protein
MVGGTIDLLALGLLALGTNGFHAFCPDLKLTYKGREDAGVSGLPCPCWNCNLFWTAPKLGLLGFHSLHHGHLEPQVLQLPIPHHYLAFQSIIFLQMAEELEELSIRTSRTEVYFGSGPLLLLTLLLLPDVTEIT